MSNYKLFRKATIAAIIAGPLTAAMATNGYFSHGYGMKAKGMGGAAVASTDDAFAGANNPAAAAWAGNRMEVGLDLFMPERSAERSGLGTVKSDSNLFYVPEFGYNRAISDKLGVGITVYGNGGMNTDYPGGVMPAANCGAAGASRNLFCGTGRLGVDLSQLIIAPTMGYKLNDTHSVGVSPLLVHQQFKAEGLSAYDNTTKSAQPGSVTNNGYDTSNGFGVRLGYLGKLSDKVSLGASYAPKIAMSKLSKYAGLFADGGSFDIPENYVIGVNVQAAPTVSVALDYQAIKYSGVSSIANPSTNNAQMGSANGPGFGWTDVNVWKLGVQWQATPKLTMRAGVNVGDNPIKSRDASMNILAPGVVTTHYTIGGTYALSKESELTVAYMNAPSNSVSGSNGTPPNGFGGTDTIKMNQQSLGIQFGWKF